MNVSLESEMLAFFDEGFLIALDEKGILREQFLGEWDACPY